MLFLIIYLVIGFAGSYMLVNGLTELLQSETLTKDQLNDLQNKSFWDLSDDLKGEYISATFVFVVFIIIGTLFYPLILAFLLANEAKNRINTKRKEQ